MDILSHGLYGGVAFGRKSKLSYWKAFFFGVMPDLCSFGIFMIGAFILSDHAYEPGPPHPSIIPSYVYTLYNITHSLVVATLVIGCVWYLQKKPMVELFAWPLHILVDIPTHSSAYFPTPFLWPLSDVTVNGISWGSPYIWYPNLALLSILYALWFLERRKQRKVLPLDEKDVYYKK